MTRVRSRLPLAAVAFSLALTWPSGSPGSSGDCESAVPFEELGNPRLTVCNLSRHSPAVYELLKEWFAMQREEPRQRDDRLWWIVVAVFLVVALLVPVLGGGIMGPRMMGGYPGYGMPFTGNGWLWGIGAGLGWLVMLAFWGALIVGAVLVFRAIAGRTESPASPGEPLDVLKRRYAAGEITREQYESMRQVLEDPR